MSPLPPQVSFHRRRLWLRYFASFLALLASPFKSNSRLEAENAALRHELSRRVQFTNSDRLFFNRAALILNGIRKRSRETHGERPRI
jgi:hypothetical protein